MATSSRRGGEARGRTVRRPAVAGRFYPGDPGRLASLVDEYLATARPASASGRVDAVIAPHAGYPYSGPIAGSAFRSLAGDDEADVRLVVLLGPAHYLPVRGLALPAADAFETPLGVVTVSREAVREAADVPGVTVQDAAHGPEHSLEVEIPFVQRVFPEAEILPLLVGDDDPGAVAELLDRLDVGGRARAVVSSDLSHYRPYHEAVVVDRATVEQVRRFEGPIGPDRACGAHAVNGLLEWGRRRRSRVEVVDLRNSGDTAGDRRSVVGYAAIAFRPAA